MLQIDGFRCQAWDITRCFLMLNAHGLERIPKHTAGTKVYAERLPRMYDTKRRVLQLRKTH